MPTKKKRVGFIPRGDVMRIIDKLSIENNLSNSKIISILVEEALSIRGIFNKKNGKLTQAYQQNYDNSQTLSNKFPSFIDNEEFSIDTKLGNHFSSGQSSYLDKPNPEAFDLKTYKMFISFLKFQEMIDKYNTR